MKNYLFIIALLTTSIIFAQTEKGKFVVSGSTGLGFGNISSELRYYGVLDAGDEYKTSTFSFTPGVGYFVMDNLAVGLSMGYSKSTKKWVRDGDTDSQSQTLLMPFAGYYFPIGGSFRPFLQIGLGYDSRLVKEESNNLGVLVVDKEEEWGGFAYSFGGGASYFIQDNVSFNLGLLYTAATLKADVVEGGIIVKAEDKQGGLGANIGISVFF